MPTGERPGRASRLGLAALRTVVLYGVLVWAYLGVNLGTHPRTVDLPLTHLASWPTEGDTAAGSFAAAAAAFFLIRLIGHARRGRAGAG